MRDQQVREIIETIRYLKITNEDHHAQEQQDGIKIYGPVRLIQR